MKREDILNEAKKQVTGHRTEDYGKPENSFQRIADLWTAYMKENANDDRVFSAKDVAMLLALLKVARIKTDTKSDSYIDLAGYAACAGEISTEETIK